MHETILSGVSLHVFISNNNYHNNLGMHSTSTEQSWRFSSKISNLKDLTKISHKKHLREKIETNSFISKTPWPHNPFNFHNAQEFNKLIQPTLKIKNISYLFSKNDISNRVIYPTL
jgi:hypothetical protein